MIQKVKVWEGAMRLYHWALALAFVGLFVTAENRLFQQHIILGKIVLGLVIFRILWGFLGGPESRFTVGFAALCQIPSYFKKLFSRGAEQVAGHTPLGWGMAFALLLAAGVQSLLGLSMEKVHNGVTYSHELSPLFANAALKHFFNFAHTEIMPAIIITLVSLHIVALAWYKWGKKQNLLPAMVTGYKATSGKIRHTNFKSLMWRAFVVAIVAAAIAWGIIHLPNILGMVA